MSYTLGCERSDTFKAVASITGTMSGYDWNNCNPNKVPVLQISGTNDMVVPMDGSMSLVGGWGGAPKIQDIMNYWGDINECTQTQTQNLPDSNKTDNSYVSIEKKVDCFNNHQVWFYTVYGGDHTWPGAWGNMDINASEEIWDFFNRYIE
jgi:polyhydroxybutyrate depolymerase